MLAHRAYCVKSTTNVLDKENPMANGYSDEYKVTLQFELPNYLSSQKPAEIVTLLDLYFYRESLPDLCLKYNKQVT